MVLKVSGSFPNTFDIARFSARLTMTSFIATAVFVYSNSAGAEVIFSSFSTVIIFQICLQITISTLVTKGHDQGNFCSNFCIVIGGEEPAVFGCFKNEA
jgi:hypothetical protein